MSTLQAFILGMVQGITEFLPISSSAHLVLFPWFFDWKDPGLAFDVFLHLGTLLAVLFYFFRDWLDLVKAGFLSIIERKIGFERDRLLFWLIVVGTIPACLAGLLFHEAAENHFRAPLLIAVNLAVVGFLLYWIDGKYAALKNTDDLRFTDAIWIGLAQAFAIIPGVSRSGSTMAMARLRGMNRETAARFSFLLSMPITLAACLFEFKRFAEDMVINIPMTYLMVGFASSLFFGLISIHFLLQYLRSADFRIFAWYRILLAILIIGWSLAFAR